MRFLVKHSVRVFIWKENKGRNMKYDGRTEIFYTMNQAPSLNFRNIFSNESISLNLAFIILRILIFFSFVVALRMGAYSR
jgi:hypothetical protein